ncbi:nitrous oxide reductase family maturation protein NosD [Thermoflavifilum thermophilum]|uniref:Nitrous oxidase accessory protein n=1 Tax=Thermoflavifilum thermophilum TaxID=1393122 RepID=A0A1I7N3C1_9BACT|nr:nitrous oxide reductase family maturation protein NosD [Thermoflavifilum thermophilum]SFV29169.1 nitrous oxidase accessory protein [Thermoflavifilum thermophilum]
MKKIFLFCFLAILTIKSRAGKIQVCASCEVQTIEKALQQAKPYDTILLRGTFRLDSAYTITMPLSIIGQQAVLDGQGKTGMWVIHANHVLIRDLILQHTGMSYVEDRAAISISKSNHISIIDVKIIQSFFGIYAYQSKHILIERNFFDGSGSSEFNAANGIHLWYCDSVNLIDNIVQHHRDGIYLEFTHNSEIRNNISSNNIRYGMHFMFSNNDAYIGNTFQSNGAGVAVMYSHHIQMKKNTFSRNHGPNAYGLLLKEIHDSEIKQNYFVENTVGIFMEECTRLNIIGNNIQSNGWAMRITGSSSNNEITQNNFLQNSFDVASLTANVQDNRFYENYWSDYRGYDLNGDNIGDVPFHPMRMFAYVVMRYDISVILLRSLLESLLNIAESVIPIVTPSKLVDLAPLMKPIQHD